MHNFFLSLKVRIFPLNMRGITIYVAQWWEKYLSKRSLLKHTCSWRDKLIVLWILDRPAKIFLRIFAILLTTIPFIAVITIYKLTTFRTCFFSPFSSLMMKKLNYKYYNKLITARENGNVQSHDQEESKLNSTITANSDAHALTHD